MNKHITTKFWGAIAVTAIVTNIIITSATLPIYAQNEVIPPLELELINEPERALMQGIFTANTVSQEGITNPSLWWIRDQFGQRVVINWLGYPQERRVDIIVDRQIWSFINYIEKYSLINRFAMAAREYGYNLRIFNDQRLLLGTATCDFPTSSSIDSDNPSNCQINLVLLSDRGLPVNRRKVPTFF